MVIEKILFRLSKEITESNHQNPLLIGIPRRGDLIAKRISNNLKNFDFSHDLDTVNYLPFRDVINEDIEKTLLTINPLSRDVILTSLSKRYFRDYSLTKRPHQSI